MNDSLTPEGASHQSEWHHHSHAAPSIDHPSDAATSMPALVEDEPGGIPASDAGSMRELLRVAIPLVISAGSQSLMNVVDRMFLTWWDPNALAASLPAILLNWTILALPFGIVIYANTFIAQYEGVGRKDRVAASLWQGVWMALGFGALVVCVVPLCTLGIDQLGHDPQVTLLEKAYFSILCYGGGFMLLNQALTAYFSGRGETWTVMFVNIIASLTNGLFDYLLIFGVGRFPEMGIQGAAIATVGANVLACIIYGVLIARRAPAAGYPMRQACRFDPLLLKRMIRFGAPQGMQYIVDVAAFTLYVVMIGWLGTVEQAATNLAFTMNSLAFVPMMGLVTAILILVGQRIGEGRPDLAAETTKHAFRLSGGFMLLCAALYVLLPKLMLIPFSSMAMEEGVQFAEVESLTIVLLRFVAIYTFFDAMAMVFGSAIRGAGDTRFSMWFTVFTSWPIMVAPTLYLAWNRFSVVVCWIPITVYIVTLGIGFWLRYRAGYWQSMKVIEEELPPDLELNLVLQGSGPDPHAETRLASELE